MKTQRLGLVLVILLAALLCNAQTNSTQTERITSPDGTITALVRSRRAPEATKESRIELRSHGGRVLVSRNYASKDGEHGYGLTKGAWTPDSQFFVYSLESSGGHQAWHTPVQFFSRHNKTIVSLDITLRDAVANPQFLVSAPDFVTVQLKSSGQTKTVSLRGLQTQAIEKHEPKPCTEQEAIQAEESTDHLKHWSDVYQSFTRFSQCDDGAIAEGCSESVARVLVDQWYTLPQLAELAKNDPKFLRFVLRHVDATDDDKDLQRVKTKAKTQCPLALRSICDDLGKEAGSALKESASFQ